MNQQSASPASVVLTNLRTLLPDLEALYEDIHAHPELSMQETRTAGLAAGRLRKAGYDVTTGVGKTGVVGLLRNGDGPTLMLRADMDALPIAEGTGLPYASKITAKDAQGKTVPVGHMCGHDMHVTWLAGAAALLVVGDMLHVSYGVSALVGAALCFGLRIMAIRYGWHLPSAGLSARRRAETGSPDDEHAH